MLEPFLKWPGGKRWLVQRHSFAFPSGWHRYIEPFLGGGAVFFHLAPLRAVLSDTNSELINTYQCIRRDAARIDKHLRSLQDQHCSEVYREIRSKRPRSEVERAVRFIYLNRTCFNGLYRVNRRGEFNVSMGSKTLVRYPEGYLSTISNSLRKATLRVSDFEGVLSKAGEGDFVFVDPPYTVLHNNNNFLRYNARLFSWSDQLRLADSIKKAARRGAQIMLSNADHQSVRDLYRGFGNHYRIARSSAIAAEASCRCRTTELLVTTYSL